MARLPKYTQRKHKGNIGEAVAQFVLSIFSIVHKIDGSNDIGNDFICELVRDQYPTNLLFYIQVKYTQDAPSIRAETKSYWRGSPIPVYLFWIKDNGDPPILFQPKDVFYKRYTPILHNIKKHRNEKFKEFNENVFKRDLFVDYARTQYIKGFTPILEPGDFISFEKNKYLGPRYHLYFKDVIPEYKKQILRRGWVNAFVTAGLLKNRGEYKKALKAVDLGMALIDQKSKREFKLFYEEMLKIKDEVTNKTVT